MYELKHYVTPAGEDIFSEWRLKLRDIKIKIAVDRRLYRLELGNFGDHKFCQDGVLELRIDLGPGYRVYYAIDGAHVILLLCAGDKTTQTTDITRACSYWQDWRRRKNET